MDLVTACLVVAMATVNFEQYKQHLISFQKKTLLRLSECTSVSSYLPIPIKKGSAWANSRSRVSSLLQSSRVHITRAVLEQFLSFAKYLDGLPHGAPLLKQLCDHVLFNAAIWIHTPAKVRSCPDHENRRNSVECSGKTREK